MRRRENFIKQMSRCISKIKWVAVVGWSLSQARPWCRFPFFVFVNEAAARRVSEKHQYYESKFPQETPHLWRKLVTG